MYLHYFKYDISDNTLKDIKQGNFDDRFYNSNTDYETNTIEDKGVSCEFLKNSNQEYVITCFYNVILSGENSLGIGFFYIYKNSGNYYIDVKSPFLHKNLNNYSLDIIKSSASLDKSKSLFCYYLSDSKTYCIIYTLLDEFENLDKFLYNETCSILIICLK